MTEVRLQNPIRAQLVQDWPADPPAGAFCYVTDNDGRKTSMIYCCPCGCHQQGCLRFRPRQGMGASWDWDGNVDQPTLNPSVHHIGHWHGWLKAGTWVQA